MKKSILTSIVLLCVATFVNAGTVVMHDGSTISDVTIVSIEKGIIIVEKEKKNVTIPLKKIKGYYKTDFNGSQGNLENLSDYKLSISKVEVKEEKKGKSRKRRNYELEVSYRIQRIGENKKYRRIKMPYFFAYILLSADDNGNRKILFNYYPKEAKFRSKNGTNDRGALMKVLSSFERETVDVSAQHYNNLKNLGDKKVDITIKNSSKRKIIAYHLEVYGPMDKLAERDWHDAGARVGKHWWRNY